MAVATGSAYHCGSSDRRDAVRAAVDGAGKPLLNGIDFLEVSADEKTIALTFLHNLPGSLVDPTPAAGPPLGPVNLVIDGGVRIRNVQVVTAVPDASAANVLVVTVDGPGDFSTYTLRLVTSADDSEPPRGFDPQLASVGFSFRLGCLKDFDCGPTDPCPPEVFAEPEINYLAKDYASFRQLLLDRMSLTIPGWQETNPADLGITLVEMLAYEADRLSYRQDAVATEAYLATARKRVSVRRHARLVDYAMHDGLNARTWVRFVVQADVIPAGPAVAVPAKTRLVTRLPGRAPNLPADPSQAPTEDEFAAASAAFFETMVDLKALRLSHNRLPFYTWGETECCLPTGTTRATLLGTFDTLKGNDTAPGAGDVLILAEELDPATGDSAGADPAHRRPVRLQSVVTLDRDGKTLTDPLNGTPITEITWHPDDALPFPLCISANVNDALVSDVSVAWGNVVLADHGRSLDGEEDLGVVPDPSLVRSQPRGLAADPTTVPASVLNAEAAAASLDATVEAPDTLPVPPRYRPSLSQLPLTQSDPGPGLDGWPGSTSAAGDTTRKLAAASPRWLSVTEHLPDGSTQPWSPARDLLESPPEDLRFVVEDDGTAFLRFGNGRNGSRPASGSRFTASYRVGNGLAGNVAAGALAHVAIDDHRIVGVSNPLPALGGVDPESIEHVTRSAPFAFLTEQRAVTLADYAEVARRHPGVQRGAAAARWTGSWSTVFVSVDRDCGCEVTPAFRADILAFLETFRMAGQDLDVTNPQRVALEIEMHVCVDPSYFRSHVESALKRVFNSQVQPDGRKGVFHPDNFTFGQPLELSTLYAAAQNVEGVSTVRITVARRLDQPATDGVAAGLLTAAPSEVLQLDNDPNFPDRGVFRLNVDGGR